MNLNPSVPVAPPPKAPAPPESPKRDTEDLGRADERLRLQQEEFARTLKAEFERKQAAVAFPTNHQPWWMAQALAPNEEAPSREVAPTEALGATEAAEQRRFLALASAVAMKPSLRAAGEDELPAAVAPVEASEGPEAVSVVVEAGLPPLQPLAPNSESVVPLVDFPQVLTGQVRQMAKNDQPVTQLQFEISPPHVGPVNLQVELQNGAVNVQLVALTLQAKQALESQVGAIHTILQAHAFTPGQIKVVTAASGKGGAGAAGQRGEQAGFGNFLGGRRRANGEDPLSINA